MTLVTCKGVKCSTGLGIMKTIGLDGVKKKKKKAESIGNRKIVEFMGKSLVLAPCPYDGLGIPAESPGSC